MWAQHQHQIWQAGRSLVASIALAAFVSACSGSAPAPAPAAVADALAAPEMAAALKAFQGSAIKQHMTVLADDALEGRGLGSPGYEQALQYVEKTVTAFGLTPAGENGGFRQRVPLRNSAVVERGSSMKVRSAAGTKTLVYAVDYLLSADPLRAQVSIEEAPVAFVGYGVSAPALGYDDYGTGLDVKGKVVAFLSGAPAMLPSNERAYYSSGAAKEAEAVKRGAIGTISFTSPDDPRFRWDVSVATGKQGGYAWIDAQGNPNRGDRALRGSASLNHSGVAALFAGASKPAAEAFAAAAKSTPQAFDLATRVSLATQSTHADVESANLIARLEGSDPALKSEHVVYIAHVDHFGRGVAMNGDAIYNGAHDNASGVAIVLDVARAYAALPTRPRRSVLFLFVTAEERGLLGSDYFARHPTVAKDSLVADLALDMPFLFHPLLDIVPYGAQHSTLAAPVSARGAAPGHRHRHRSDPGAGAVHPQRSLQLRAAGRALALPQERIQDRRSGQGRLGHQRRLPPRRVSQAQRRHVAAVRLRRRRHARAAQLPHGLARGAGNRPGRRGIRGLLRRAVRHGAPPAATTGAGAKD